MEKMTKKTSESEGNKRYYASISHEFMKGKGKRIKLTPNEKCLLGLIVYRSQHEGGIHFANKTICGVFGWQPNQLYRACNSLVAKGIIARDTSKAMYGKKGTEYTLLLERDETEQQPSEAPVQYQPIVVQTVQEPPHVKPFHERQTQPNDNEVVALLKEQNTLLKDLKELLHQHLESLHMQVEHPNTLISQNKSSVSPSKPSDEQLPTKKEIVDSTPTPHADLDTSDEVLPTPQVDSGHSDEVLPTPHQSDYLMAVVTAEEGGTIGGLEVAKLEPNERERTVQEARQRARKVMNNCEKNGMNPRDAAMKAREAIEEEYSSKLWGDPTFHNILDKLTYYSTGMDAECPI